MTSFFDKCPQCGAMIAKGSPCPACRSGSAAAPPSEAEIGSIAEYARRREMHTRNYSMFMGLMMLTGVVGLVTAWMWIRTIYRGDVGAFVWVILLTIVSAGLGVVLSMSKKLFPTEVLCPACNMRIDELGLTGDHCPGCMARLR
jgi:hypothetical protein